MREEQDLPFKPGVRPAMGEKTLSTGVSAREKGGELPEKRTVGEKKVPPTQGTSYVASKKMLFANAYEEGEDTAGGRGRKKLFRIAHDFFHAPASTKKTPGLSALAKKNAGELRHQEGKKQQQKSVAGVCLIRRGVRQAAVRRVAGRRLGGNSQAIIIQGGLTPSRETFRAPQTLKEKSARKHGFGGEGKNLSFPDRKRFFLKKVVSRVLVLQEKKHPEKSLLRKAVPGEGLVGHHRESTFLSLKKGREKWAGGRRSRRKRKCRVHCSERVKYKKGGTCAGRKG